MTSSTGSSSSSAALALLALLGAACGGPRAAGGDAARPPARVLKVALLPADNLAAGPVPLRELDGELLRVAQGAGLQVVSGEPVEDFLEKHRLRFTGGIDATSAAAAREELGVDAILLAEVEAYASQPAPRLAVTARLVSATPEARLLWIDGVARAGDDSPGLLGLGLVRDPRALEARELARLRGSLARALETGVAAPPCPDEGRFEPRVAFRSPQFDPGGGYSVAVLPFFNETSRRRAGELLALELTRQLAAYRRLQVVEPGVTRDRLRRYRVIMEGGVSLDTARAMIEVLQTDVVIAGYVRELVDGDAPSMDFTAMALDRAGRLVWQATSHATGNDRVWLFEQGRVSTASALACRLSRSAAVSLFGATEQAPASSAPTRATEERRP
ncbi:hypothetical protein [Anaeromyxobacter paludicola]|uniref:Lipoprotein n=1 Tax=Anaeromyxobacter paludicola TaxID=2918171 RepID=A0ABM7XBQ2_9BACT|nr:hypothetical protein [Anaeromyxobacter paludicola]BDG09251.1 lipoprotein [Anaeromyxobacter paludicola]